MNKHPTRSAAHRFDRSDGHADRLASQARRRDIVVIGASAGGVTPLLDIVADLPADFDTPIAIVLHRTSKPPWLLAGLLARRCKLNVVEAKTGDALVPRTIYCDPRRESPVRRTPIGALGSAGEIPDREQDPMR